MLDQPVPPWVFVVHSFWKRTSRNYWNGLLKVPNVHSLRLWLPIATRSSATAEGPRDALC